jgi:hypothetical protein
MAAKKGSRTWFPRVDGGVHQRIWFAKAGKGTQNDTGIAPPADQQIKNGTYSINLAIFDPTTMTQKEAAEAGKEGSMYPGYGAQFGAQIWRMAHEAKVGDIIFLESENHHLHALGIISGEFLPFDDIDYTVEMLNTRGVHRIPVKWIPVKDGKDFIQLGRLDNAIFRDISEKEELASLLIFGTQKLVAEAMGIDYKEFEDRMEKVIAAVNTGENEDEEEAEEDIVVTIIDEPEKPVAQVVEAPKPVFAHVARNGAYIHQKIDESTLHDLIYSSKVLPTDHVFHPVSTNWITVAEYLRIRCRI